MSFYAFRPQCHRAFQTLRTGNIHVYQALKPECAEKRLILFPSVRFFLVLRGEQELVAILTLAAPCSVGQELQHTLEGYTSCAPFHNEIIKYILVAWIV